MRDGTKMAPYDDDERSEARLRQMAEIEFLQSAYSKDEASVSSDADGCVVIRRALHLSAAWGGDGAGESGSEHFDAAAVKVELSIVMPTLYPVQENAILIVKGSLISY